MGSSSKVYFEIYEKTYSFSNGANENIHCVQWLLSDDETEEQEPKNPRANVLIIHGAAEHCGWYKEAIALPLLKQNFAVFAHDHIGHGKSGGRRVDIDKFATYVDDCYTHLAKILVSSNPSVPLFLIGHSMGGAIAILVARRQPEIFRGVVLIGPLIQPNPKTVNAVKTRMVRSLAKVNPTRKIAAFNSLWICRRDDVCQQYRNDKLMYRGRLKARWIVECLNAGQDIRNNFHKITYPFLTLHGTVDKLCDISGSEMLYKNAASKDKTFISYEGCYHQLHNEPEPDVSKFKEDLLGWMLKRC